MFLTKSLQKAALVHWNVGLSFKTKVEEIRALCSMEVPVICLNEGNLDHTALIPGYVVYRDEHAIAGKSRASILVRADLPQTQIKLRNVQGAHLCAVSVKLQSEQWSIVTVYISPNETVDAGSLMNCLKAQRWEVITGDFNAKSEAWGSPHSCNRGRNIQKILEDDLELVVINDGRPTFRRNFRSGMVESHLDVTAVSEDNVGRCSWNVEDIANVTDHARCWITLEGLGKKGWRNANVTDWVEYRRELDGCGSLSDVCSAIKAAKRAATKKVRLPYWAPPPDVNLVQMFDDMEKVKNQFRRTGLLYHYVNGERKKEEIRQYCMKLQQKQSASFVSSLSPTSNLTSVWQWIKKNSGNAAKSPFMGCCIANNIDPNEALDQLLDSAVGGGSDLLKTGDSEIVESDTHVSRMVCKKFTLWELEAAIEAGCARSACGPDEISNKDLKSLPLKAKYALLSVFNGVLESGCWPTEWKSGEGIPLQKIGKDSARLGSYRIIVKSSHVGKLLERMFLRRLMVVLEEKCYLTDEMSAYRPLRSPQDNILDFWTDVEEALAGGDHVVAVFFDVSGAYNKLRHSVIEDTLRDLGIHSSCGFYKACISHLTDRTIRMKCDTVVTDTRAIPNHGASQGAVLSLILFAASTKRLRRHLPRGFMLSQFSDDGVLWIRCKGRSPCQVRLNHLQTVLALMVEELKKMGLTIEPDKTVMMPIGPKKDPLDALSRLKG